MPNVPPILITWGKIVPFGFYRPAGELNDQLRAGPAVLHQGQLSGHAQWAPLQYARHPGQD